LLGGEAGVEDDDGFGRLGAGQGQAIQHVGQSLGFGDVALKDVVGQREAPAVKGHADGHLPTVVALLLVFAVAGFRVLFAEPLGNGFRTPLAANSQIKFAK
jgi:hypothetical protein